jgi:enoyl-CoA hydratase/carnithine racemase
LVVACHLAIAVEMGRFGLPGVRLGVMPMTIMPSVLWSMPRKVALELVLTGPGCGEPRVGPSGV